MRFLGSLRNGQASLLSSLTDTVPFPCLRLCSWGRTASGGFEGYVPSPAAAELLWDRTLRLSLAFDAQGAANMLVRAA